jgi:hypothetical protein
VSIDYLDRSNPVPIRFGNDMFDELCKGWKNPETTFDLLKRESDERARAAAAAVARQARPIINEVKGYVVTLRAPERRPQPTFTPVAVTTTFAAVKDEPEDDYDIGELQKAWETDEHPILDFDFPDIPLSALWKNLKRAGRTFVRWCIG